MRMQYAPPPSPFLHDTGLEITSVLPLPLGDCFIEGQPQPPVLHGRCPDQGVDVQQYPNLQTFPELTIPARVCYDYETINPMSSMMKNLFGRKCNIDSYQ